MTAKANMSRYVTKSDLKKTMRDDKKSDMKMIRNTLKKVKKK